jgi:hypothetical protein
MSEVALAALVSLVEEAVKLEPSIAAEFRTLFNNPEATPADWQAVRTRVLGQSFESLAPDAKLS